MSKFINEIDKNIIKSVLSDEEFGHYKDIAKRFAILKEEKRILEAELKEKIKGIVIGELSGVELNYLNYGDTFYVSYRAITP